MKFTSILTNAGQSISGLASTYLKDPSYFRELCDENGWNPLGDTPLPVNINAKIPDPLELIPSAKSKLDRAQATVNAVKGRVEQAGRLTGQISGMLDKIDIDKLPVQFRGYSRESLEAIKEVNGAIGDISSTLTETLEKADKSIGKVRQYGGQRTRLVDWLLS